MILVIDNYDSFAYNLVQYLGELGEDPIVYRNDAITLGQIEALAPSHIVISPGPCTPLEAGISNDVIRHFRECAWDINASGMSTAAPSSGPKCPYTASSLSSTTTAKRFSKAWPLPCWAAAIIP